MGCFRLPSDPVVADIVLAAILLPRILLDRLRVLDMPILSERHSLPKGPPPRLSLTLLIRLLLSADDHCLVGILD